MRHDSPTPHGRRGGLIAATATALLLLTACSGSRPSISADPTVGATSAPVTPAPKTSVATAGAAAAAPATVAPSGDVELDKLDSDLSAFEQENSGLDQAAAATQEK